MYANARQHEEYIEKREAHFEKLRESAKVMFQLQALQPQLDALRNHYHYYLPEACIAEQDDMEARGGPRWFQKIDDEIPY